MATSREQFLFGSDNGVAGLGLGIEIGEVTSGRVYNTTTVPVTNSGGWRHAQSSVTPPPIPTPPQVTYTNGSSATASKQPPLEPVEEEEVHFDTDALNNLPAREPVDMEFRDLSLTVKLGFNRGELYNPLRSNDLRYASIRLAAKNLKLARSYDRIRFYIFYDQRLLLVRLFQKTYLIKFISYS